MIFEPCPSLLRFAISSFCMVFCRKIVEEVNNFYGEAVELGIVIITPAIDGFAQV